MDNAIGKDLPSSIFATKTDPPPSNSSPTAAISQAIIIVASSLAVLGAFTGIAWLILQPDEPTIAVSALSLSNFNASYTQLQSNGSDTLQIGIANSNTVSDLVIDPFDVSVYYHDTQLSVATVPGPIYVQSKNQTKMKVRLGVQDHQFGHSKVAANPKPWEQFPGLPDPTKFTGTGNGDFNVKTSIRMTFKALYHMLTWRMHLDVRCRISDMRFFHLDNTWDVYGVGYCDVSKHV